jgi:hypothetical protein
MIGVSGVVITNQDASDSLKEHERKQVIINWAGRMPVIFSMTDVSERVVSIPVILNI